MVSSKHDLQSGFQLKWTLAKKSFTSSAEFGQ